MLSYDKTMELISLLIGVSMISAPVVETPPYVISHNSTIVERDGAVVISRPNVEIPLVTGDIVRAKSGYGVGEAMLSDGSKLILESYETKLLFLNRTDPEETLFECTDGLIHYIGSTIHGTNQQKPGMDEPDIDDQGISGRRLVRTSQRSLGTRGTEFRLTIKPRYDSEYSILEVISGKVVYPRLKDASDGREYNAGSNTRFSDTKALCTWIP